MPQLIEIRHDVAASTPSLEGRRSIATKAGGSDFRLVSDRIVHGNDAEFGHLRDSLLNTPPVPAETDEREAYGVFRHEVIPAMKRGFCLSEIIATYS